METIMKNYLRKLSPVVILTGLTLFLFSGNLFAASTNLVWSASTSSNVGGYIVSYGQSSGNYTSNIDVGNTTTYLVSGLQAGSTYYFSVKTYNLARTTQSAYSNVVKLTVPVTTALTADFTKSTTSGVASLVVKFTPVTTGTVTSWAWAFPGSYTPSIKNTTAQAVNVTYPTAGSYSVSLTVTGPGGSVTKTYSNLITVTAPPPVVTPPQVVTTPPVTGTGNGLLAAYGFEEISGATVTDASGQGNHGTISNAVRTTSGHSGKALQFNGTNAWVTVNDSASLDLSTGMTLESWVYPQSLGSGGKTVITKENSATAEVYSLYAKEDTTLPISYIAAGSYSSISGSNPLPVNQWTHLVATYNGQYQRLYVNGKEIANSKQNGLIQQSTGVLRIGGNSFWGEYFQGYIDEVRIYNRALTSAEVNYNLTTAISVSNPAHFVMGDITRESWIGYKTQGTAQAYQTTPQKNGVVTTLQIYLDVSSTATEMIAGIYKNNKGHPGAIVTQGKLSALKPGAWNSVPIPVVSVTAAEPYWIAILGSKGQIGFLNRIGSATGMIETSTSTTLTSLPGTWTGTTYQPNSAMSAFGLGY